MKGNATQAPQNHKRNPRHQFRCTLAGKRRPGPSALQPGTRTPPLCVAAPLRGALSRPSGSAAVPAAGCRESRQKRPAGGRKNTFTEELGTLGTGDRQTVRGKSNRISNIQQGTPNIHRTPWILDIRLNLSSAAGAVRPPGVMRPACNLGSVAAPLRGALTRNMRVQSPAIPGEVVRGEGTATTAAMPPGRLRNMPGAGLPFMPGR